MNRFDDFASEARIARLEVRGKSCRHLVKALGAIAALG
jgi:hypothetical protein